MESRILEILDNSLVESSDRIRGGILQHPISDPCQLARIWVGELLAACTKVSAAFFELLIRQRTDKVP